jgi:hypothetical protein
LAWKYKVCFWIKKLISCRGGDFGQDSHSKGDEEFWNYSMNEVLEFDLICQLETMLKVSGAKKFFIFKLIF